MPSLRALALAPSSACDPTRIGSRRGAARLRARRRVTDVETGERPTFSEAVRRFLSWFSSAAILRPRWLPFFPHPERRVSRPSFRLRGRPARTVRCRLSASAARPDKVRRKRHRGATVPGASSDPVSTRVRAASSSGYSQSPRRFTRKSRVHQHGGLAAVEPRRSGSQKDARALSVAGSFDFSLFCVVVSRRCRCVYGVFLEGSCGYPGRTEPSSRRGPGGAPRCRGGA